MKPAYKAINTYFKMKLLCILVPFVFLTACADITSQQTAAGDNTSASKSARDSTARSYFKTHIAGGNINNFPEELFAAFIADFYPELKTAYTNLFLYAMEEDFIDSCAIDSSRQMFRVTVDPCFRRPYCIVVEKKAGKGSLSIKITDGYGGQYPGLLASTTRFQFVGDMYDQVSRKLDSLRFFELGKDTTCGMGLDGEWWLLEFVERGRYNAIHRWVPQHCGDSTTRQLARLVKEVARQGNLDEILVAIGAPPSDL